MRRMSTTRRVRIFDTHGGICHICGCKIDGTREPWEAEHIIPLEISGDDSDDNLAPAHIACHRSKTKDDARDIAKAKRVRAKHIGAFAKTRRPLPGSKASKFKAKIGGGFVRRDEK